MDIIAFLTADIKSKKELSGVADDVVIEKIKIYMKKSPDKQLKEKLAAYSNEKQLRRNSHYKNILKKVRQELHESFGIYQIPGNASTIKADFLKKLKVNQANEDDYERVLSLHVSTKERIHYYPIIYSKIFNAIKPKAKTILDLGCGMNPVSAYYLGFLGNIEYIASDIDWQNLEFVKKYFELAGIDGKTQILDLSKESEIEKLAAIRADVCFMFKILENDKRLADDLISTVDARYIVASFSTVSVSGKIMESPERNWFEKMLARLGLKYEVFKTENEIFYIVKKF